MKKFSFPLERALAWRRLQRDQEVAQIETLLASRQALASRAQAIRDERNSFERSLAHSLNFEADSVATLPHWQAGLRNVLSAVASERRQLEDRIVIQQACLRSKEREVKLLERLREKRHDRWTVELDREQETFAAEAYLARCSSKKKEGSSD